MTNKIYTQQINGISYEIRKMRQAKRMSLKIAQDGRVWVSMPHYASVQQAQQFIREQLPFIRATLDRIREIQNEQKIQQEHLLLPVRGKWLPVEIMIDQHPNIALDAGRATLVISIPASLKPDEQVRYALQYWQHSMENEARLELPHRTLELAAGVGATVHRITIRNQKSRWGSCSKSRRSISLNWRCILFPHAVRDYLIYHELGHLHHPNHSSRYWQLVEQWVPDYREAERWISQNGQRLMAINRVG